MSVLFIALLLIEGLVHDEKGGGLIFELWPSPKNAIEGGSGLKLGHGPIIG